MPKIVGAATLSNGKRVSLDEDFAKKLWDDAEREKELRAKDLPDSQSALSSINRGMVRLRELGWREDSYFPKDETLFAVIEFGSGGIFQGFYSGDWPRGHLIYAEGATNVGGCMWKPIEKLTQEEAEHMNKCEADNQQWMETQLKAFSAIDDE